MYTYTDKYQKQLWNWKELKVQKKKKKTSEENDPIKTEKNDLLSHYLT